LNFNLTGKKLQETILNIYLIIENEKVISFKAKAYKHDDNDNIKIQYLKNHVKPDFKSAYTFDAPENKKGEFMSYNEFAKLEKAGRQFELFEEIFTEFEVPENPLICVTPVVDGEIVSE